MASSIRINSGTKKIEVNDEGEYILLPLGDDKFIREFYKMMDEAREKVQKVQDEKIGENDILGGMNQVVEIDSILKERTEHLFGEGTCRKVFGDIAPGLDLFMDFFNQLVPFVEEYQQERAARLNKYDARRTGSAV